MKTVKDFSKMSWFYQTSQPHVLFCVVSASVSRDVNECAGVATSNSGRRPALTLVGENKIFPFKNL